MNVRFIWRWPLGRYPLDFVHRPVNVTLPPSRIHQRDCKTLGLAATAPYASLAGGNSFTVARHPHFWFTRVAQPRHRTPSVRLYAATHPRSFDLAVGHPARHGGEATVPMGARGLRVYLTVRISTLRSSFHIHSVCRGYNASVDTGQDHVLASNHWTPFVFPRDGYGASAVPL